VQTSDLGGVELADHLGGIEDALHHDGRVDDQIGPLGDPSK
jgi:hypothetical protein